MARVVFITLAFMAITLLGIHLMRGDMHEQVRLRMEQLSRDTAQLLTKTVQWKQRQNWAAKGAPLLAALQHWHIWAFPAGFLLFFGLIWSIRKTRYLPGSSSMIWIIAAILVVFLKTFISLMKVARKVFIALAFMGIIRLGIHLTPGDMHEQVQLRMEQLSRDMAQLLTKTVQWKQWQNWAAKGAPLLAALQHWHIWAFPAGFLLFFGLIWCIRKTRYLPRSSSIIWICAAILTVFLKLFFFLTKVARMLACIGSSLKRSRNKEDDDNEEEDSDSDETWDLGRVWAYSTEWPAPYMADKCQLVEELVDDLLRTCRGQTCHSFTPQLQPAIGVCVYEEWSTHDGNVIYQLLVPVRPPPGHTFHVELDDAEETATSRSCLRVQLECTCTRERLLGDMLCFLHHDQEELREKQGPSLLDTFCTGSYLHVEKSALWLQDQVKAAWRHLPQSRDCRLELLPSHRSCKIRLTTPSNCTFTIEMTLGVQLDESDTFLSIE